MPQKVKDAPDKTKTRLIYDSCYNVIEIREFSYLAKLGERRVKVTRFKYDDNCCLLSRIIPRTTTDAVTYEDLGVPPKPVITGTVPACPNVATTITVDGTCTADNGDVVHIYADGERLKETGAIAANAFSFSIDLAAVGYTAPANINLTVRVQNLEGESEYSDPLIYNLI